MERAPAAGTAPEESATPETPAAPAGVRRSRVYFPELESLRGVAIVLVFLYHADGALLGSPKVASPLTAFVRAGHTGVALFFVLSGLLLGLPFLAEAAGGRRQGRREYCLRRALRILPAYYAVLVVAILLAAKRPFDVAEWWSFFIFTSALAPQHALWPFSVGWWSVATEVQFYLILPLLPAIIRSRRRLLIALGLYALSYGTFLAGVWHLPGRWQYDMLSNVFGRAPLFLWGIFAAWLYQTHGRALRARLAAMPWIARGGADLALLSVLVGLGFFLRWHVRTGFWEVEATPRHTWHIAEGALWASVVLLLLLAPLRTKRLLCNRLLGCIGVVSYSLFLIHIPVVVFTMMRVSARVGGGIASWDAQAYLVTAVLFVACVTMSTILYWTIERPFLMHKARLDR
jgi:peptidoglycan/LPS O-acetylase OafA/YrhL